MVGGLAVGRVLQVVLSRPQPASALRRMKAQVGRRAMSVSGPEADVIAVIDHCYAPTAFPVCVAMSPAERQPVS